MVHAQQRPAVSVPASGAGGPRQRGEGARRASQRRPAGGAEDDGRATQLAGSQR